MSSGKLPPDHTADEVYEADAADESVTPHPSPAFEKYQQIMRNAARRLRQIRSAVAEEEHRNHIRDHFESLVPEVSDLGRKLNNYAIRPQLRLPHFGEIADSNSKAHLFFCGFLEGDFSERSYLPMPILLAGGFFLKTACGNVLFDPGMGTLAGMRELGVDLPKDTDAIIVSHYHPSARFDLHTLLNEFGGYCPGRASSGETSAAAFPGLRASTRIPLLSSTAVIHGRNDHPATLIPSDLKVVTPTVAKPGKAWYLARSRGNRYLEETDFPATPREGALLIQTVPAFHSETARPGEDWDDQGLAGTELSCFLLQTTEFGFLFTGDTEYPRWSEETWRWLNGKVTVLIANMKTIEYLGTDAKAQRTTATPGIRPWDQLALTKNQLGFEGTRQLAMKLRPDMLVVRALGLECVVAEGADGALRYVPERLAIYREALQALLAPVAKAPTSADTVARPTKVIIPGRHEVLISSEAGESSIQEHAIVPAFNGSRIASFGADGQIFETTNHDLTREIQSFIHRLKSDERPFMVIQGESGGGKTMLANAIARELTKELTKDHKTYADLINQFDLATVETDSAMHGSLLFGWKAGLHWEKDEGNSGYFAQKNGILILNQLEKFPSSESRKFLDLLESWRYKQRGIKEDQVVKVKIIFTTNVAVEMLSNLTPDLKNRLAGKCITLPSLDNLPMNERRKEIDLFVTRWCEKSMATLEANVWDQLHRLDLANGGYRCLRELLDRAKALAQSAYGLLDVGSAARPVTIFIEKKFFDQAMKLNGVHVMATNRPESNRMTRGLIWLVAIWISDRCVNKDTYARLMPGKGTSSGKFNDRLAEFVSHFESGDAAWRFMQGTDSAREALANGSISTFIETLVSASGLIAQAPESPTNQFKQGNDREWLEERARALREVLLNDGDINSSVRLKFVKHLNNIEHG